MIFVLVKGFLCLSDDFMQRERERERERERGGGEGQGGREMFVFS